MVKPDYLKVKETVDRVLKENMVVQPPISPEEIAENYGISINPVIFSEKYKDVAGFFDFEEEKIFVNSEDPYNRRTFTIAHELGHYFLHKKYFIENPKEYKVLHRMPIGAVNDDPLEKEANAFAANLLVPKFLLSKYKDYASTDELAKLFSVSKDVIRNRQKFEYGI